jgi:hypothetical protein
MAGKSAPENETDAQKVLRLGNARLNKAVKAIRQLRNLGSYKPTKGQTDAAFGIIQKEVDTAKTAWQQQKRPDIAEGFQLPKA